MSSEIVEFFSEQNVTECFYTIIKNLHADFLKDERSFLDQEVYFFQESSINIFCYQQKFTIEFLIDSNVKDSGFSTLETVHKVIRNEEYKDNNESYFKNAAKVFSKIYLKISDMNPELNYCYECKEIYIEEAFCGVKQLNRGKLIDGMCEKCEAPTFLKIRKYVNKKYSCDICYSNLLDKLENKKILYTKMYKIECCKGKIICHNCYDKLDSHISCECGNCNVKCPFCKQEISVSNNL